MASSAHARSFETVRELIAEGTVTGSANSTTTGELTVLPRTTAKSYTLAEAITSASGTVLSDYSQSWSCTNNGVADGALPSGSGLSKAVSPQAGDFIACTVTNTQQPTLRNSASVTGDVPDPVASNNIDGTSTKVQGLLKIRKTASRTRIRAGGTLSYRITVTNASAFALRSVRVCDDLPAGLVFVSSAPKAKLSGGQRCWTIRTARREEEQDLHGHRSRAERRGRPQGQHRDRDRPGCAGARSRAAADTAPVQVIAGVVRSGGVTG